MMGTMMRVVRLWLEGGSPHHCGGGSVVAKIIIDGFIGIKHL
jgi:hypothetical protein